MRFKRTISKPIEKEVGVNPGAKEPLILKENTEKPKSLFREVEAFSGIDERLSIDQEAINSFVDEALGRPEKLKTLALRKVTNDEAVKIKKLIGLDVSGYIHELSNYDLRHAIKPHGDAATEAKKGQLPITDKDLKAIPEIVNSPDRILPRSSKDVRKSVVYEKRVNGFIYYVEAVLPREGTLRSKIMWKKPAAVDHALPKGVLHYTSETDRGLTSSTDAIISQEARTVNKTSVSSDLPESIASRMDDKVEYMAKEIWIKFSCQTESYYGGNGA